MRYFAEFDPEKSLHSHKEDEDTDILRWLTDLYARYTRIYGTPPKKVEAGQPIFEAYSNTLMAQMRFVDREEPGDPSLRFRGLRFTSNRQPHYIITFRS